MTKNIKAMFIFEMIGKPKEYLVETLGEYIKNLEMKGVSIINKKIHEPKEYENNKVGDIELFSSFAEVELVFDDLNLLFGIAFRMLPSHVEILEPGELDIKNFELAQIISDLAVKLHKYDEIVKVLMMEKDNLIMQLNKANAQLGKNSVKIEELVKDDQKEKEVENKKP